MIAFDLKCGNGHVFEGWFENAASFDRQLKKGQIACPICDNTAVARQPSCFAIRKTASSPMPDEGRHRGIPALPPDEQKALARLNQEIHAFVENNFDDVGCDFTKEALKMHYGVTEPRNIRGVSTQAEEKVLKDEGIHFYKIPVHQDEPDTDA